MTIKEKAKSRYLDRKARGVCVSCGNTPAMPDRVNCPRCAANIKDCRVNPRRAANARQFERELLALAIRDVVWERWQKRAA